MDWQSISTAPKDGTRFLALNHDGEIWVCRFTKDGRLCFRTNKLVESSVHVGRTLDDGTFGMVRDDERSTESWQSAWTLWTRGYDFAPKMWLYFDEPPQ